MGRITLRGLWHCWKQQRAKRQPPRTGARIGLIEALEDRSLLSTGSFVGPFLSPSIPALLAPLVPGVPGQQAIFLSDLHAGPGEDVGTTVALNKNPDSDDGSRQTTAAATGVEISFRPVTEPGGARPSLGVDTDVNLGHADAPGGRTAGMVLAAGGNTLGDADDSSDPDPVKRLAGSTPKVSDEIARSTDLDDQSRSTTAAPLTQSKDAEGKKEPVGEELPVSNGGVALDPDIAVPVQGQTSSAQTAPVDGSADKTGARLKNGSTAAPPIIAADAGVVLANPMESSGAMGQGRPDWNLGGTPERADQGDRDPAANLIEQLGPLDATASGVMLPPFLDPFARLGEDMASWMQETRLWPWLLGIGAGALAVELCRRRRQQTPEELTLAAGCERVTVTWFPE